LAAGSSTRATTKASAKVASRAGRRGKSRSRPSLRAVPSAAATWPCGQDRSIASRSGDATNVSPLSARLSASILASGQRERLASVRVLTLPPSR
jgi:hypothetical protein